MPVSLLIRIATTEEDISLFTEEIRDDLIQKKKEWKEFDER